MAILKRINMKAVRAAAFVVVFCVLFSAFSQLLSPPHEIKSRIDYEPCNTIDVLFVGSSHMYYGLNPNIMWREEGIASYSYSSNMQPLWTSYYFILEALKTQKPQLVVLDVLYMSDNFRNGYNVGERPAFSTFPLSKNKLDIILAGAEPEGRFALLFSLVEYHTRWRHIKADSLPGTKENYMKNSSRRYKGFEIKKILDTLDLSPELNDIIYPATEEEREIPVKNLIYLQKIIDLSKERGFDLLLIKTPSSPTLTLEAEQQAYNVVKRIAAENQIGFIDLNENRHREAMGFDYSTDFFEATHINYNGSEKVSEYLAPLLKAEYGLPDRRGDSAYVSWEESADGFFRYLALERARLNPDLPSYLEAIKGADENLIFITSVRDNASTTINSLEEGQTLLPLGITIDFSSKKNNSYLCIYEPSSGYRYEEVADSKKLRKKIYKDDLTINVEIVSGGRTAGNASNILIDGVDHSKNKRGLNIVIYDKDLGTVFDSFYVDIAEDESLTIQR